MFKLSSDYPVDYPLGAALAAPLLVAGLLVVLLQRKALKDEKRFVSVSAKSRNVGGRTSWWALLPIVAYVGVAVVLPVFALIVVSVSPFWSGKIEPSHFTFNNWAAAFSDTKVTDAITTSVTAIGITLLIVLPLGYLAALALMQRSRVPRVVRTAIDVMSNLSLSLPAALFGFAFLFTYTVEPFKLYGTTAMIVVAYVTLMIPYAIRPQLSSMLSTGGEYVEASRACGAGFLRTSVRISLPLIRTGLGVAAALIVVMLIHEFAASLMVTSVRTQVLGTILYSTWSSGTSSEVAVIALIMVAVTSVGVGLAVLLGGSKALEEM
jgi:iron(III) transport system permease protein